MDSRALLSTFAAPSFAARPISATEIELLWNQVRGASEYVVQELVNNKWGQLEALNSGARGYAVMSLKPSTVYTFDVGYIRSGVEYWMTAESAKTLTPPPPRPPVPAPSAPTWQAAVASDSQINVTWIKIPNATTYLLEELNGSAWTTIATTVGTGWSVAGLKPNTAYEFDVAARNASGTKWGDAAYTTTYQVYTALTEPVATTPPNGNPASQPLPYDPVQGPLFGPNGPSYTDVHQGETLGDCWLLSSLSVAAARDPQAIVKMFTYEGTELVANCPVALYNVTLYNCQGGNNQNTTSTSTIEVDTELPSAGEYFDQPQNGILWVALAEKAYVEASALGYVSVLPVSQNSYSGTDNYWALNDGYASYALHAITGHAAYDCTPMDAVGTDNSLTYGMTNGYLMCIGTSGPVDPQIANDHYYGVIAQLSINYEFTLMNPWGVVDPANPSDPANLYAVDPFHPGYYYGLFPASESFIQSNWSLESFCLI
jgi:hypothetical protein